MKVEIVFKLLGFQKGLKNEYSIAFVWKTNRFTNRFNWLEALAKKIRGIFFRFESRRLAEMK